jgi:hypothetical protein
MKKKLFLIVFIILGAWEVIDAQTMITEEKDLYPVSVTIEQDKNTGGTLTGYTSSAYSVGRKKNTDNSSFIARSYHDFDLTDFPDNTQIDEVKVYYSTGGTGYSFKLTKLSSVSTTDLGANWASIGSGTEMDKGIAYNLGEQNFLSSKIKTEMQNLLTGDKIILGALCENETADDSYSSLLIHLHVTYKRPLNTFPYNAANYYNGSVIAGQIGVGLGQPPTTFNSPKQFDAIENQNINLLAYDNQDISTRRYLFNDTEAPQVKSKWEQDISGIFSDIGLTQSITVVASSTNDGASIPGLLKTKL